MAIRELFNQAVIGSEREDALSALLQINRPEINVAAAYMPLLPQADLYLRSLDVEKRYIEGGIGHNSGYGRDIADFSFNADSGFAFYDGSGRELPHFAGREAFLDEISTRAALFSKVTEFENVRGFLRILPATKDNLVWHRDNRTDRRGLQTLLGDMNTLWLPDQVLPQTLLITTKYLDGAVGNKLVVPFEIARDHAMQIEPHHMSIHKGEMHENPLYHSAPGYRKDLNMAPGTRVLLTLDQD